jgi:hypothetical protein
MRNTKELAKFFHERSATLFLSLLIAGDLAFIALHVADSKMGINKLLDLSLDRGHPEFYQYMKLLWICGLLAYISLRWTSKHYGAWLLLFAYLLLDDSLRIHERGGKYIAIALGFQSMLGLRIEDYGEIAFIGIIGTILLLPLIWAYRNGSQIFRRISQDLALLIAILLFFGIGVDIAHSIFKFGSNMDNLDFLFGIVEDGGEMLSVSLILWYVFFITIRPCNTDYYLRDLARSFLSRHSKGRTKTRR